MFLLSIITPEKVFFEGEIKSLVVPGTEGYLGILSNHAPLITALIPGRIEFRDADDKVNFMAVSGGFIEVSNNKASILAEAVERADEIDIERARTALKRETDSLTSADEDETEIDKPSIQAAIERANNRIRVYKEGHHQ
ncbi:MAG: ATP synthase F1 subunit epsilon [candidate division Zixibacteria bacterium]|nr:ATP synthase F1 subunit epsilon [candidate division Zixibacteria bacterium]